MVYYLKYRPKTLNELDNEEVAGLLQRYLSSKNVPHAFLFAGPRGTGKTSTARIVGKSLNCTGSKTAGTACGKCDVCQGIARGELLDILEIDAASNRGIDEIRDLREKIKLAPLHLKYKVYIIDEVHMLTNEAFNALLKTLEEPPAHAVFVLATTEVHKVPETVISRCIKVEFRRATNEEIVHSLTRIVTGEKLTVDREALTVIATAADGSFRDGAKFLQEVALETNHVTKAQVLEKLGTTDITLQQKFLTELRHKHAKELLLLIGKLTEDGKNVRQFFLALLIQLEQILLALYQGEEKEWDKMDVTRAIKILSAAFVELKSAVLPQLPFELAVVDYCENASVATTPSVAPHAIQPQVAKQTTEDTPDLGPFAGQWTEVLAALKPHNHSLVGILRSCRPLAFADKTLTIEAGFKFHADRLADERVHDILAKVVKEVTGLDIKIAVVSRKR